MAVPADEELKKLLKQFVCVRVVQMWGADLTQFQFDGTLTWAVFFLNANGTLYGRYGSRSNILEHQAIDKIMSLEGFKKSIQAALRLHREYQEDSIEVGRQLAGKTGSKPLWKTPQEIPELLKGYAISNSPFKGWDKNSCIHCHMLQPAEIVSRRLLKKPLPDHFFWPYPIPREIGMEMDPKEVATILDITKGSPVARAGLRKGDKIKTMNKQPILSTADIQWILHNAKDPARLRINLERKGEAKTVTLVLRKGWRATLRIAEGKWLHARGMEQFFNLFCFGLEEKKRKELGLDPNSLALICGRPNQNELRRRRRPDRHLVLGEVPLQKGDIIIGIDGRKDIRTQGGFMAYLFRKKFPGQPMQLTVLRGGKKMILRFKVPE